MSENKDTAEIPELDHESSDDEIKQNEKINEIDLNDGIVRRSDKTVKETVKDAKQRAIDNFKRGVIDPEYRVVKMANGKYRTYKRKESLPPDPIKLNQVAENKRSCDIVNSVDDINNVEMASKSKAKQHDPFADIVWYNMSNQISEQLNKRLDAVNLELERLRHKNSKLKGKYKQLKQAIYITEEEDVHEDKREQQDENVIEQQQQQNVNVIEQQQQQQQYQNVESAVIRPTRRTTAINFNRFFN